MIERLYPASPQARRGSSTYYDHGVLKKKEIGSDNPGQRLQGIDYVYNINGLLKNINTPLLSPEYDPGFDDDDFFGMSLDYYWRDYERENNFINFGFVADDYYMDASYDNNGNIQQLSRNGYNGTGQYVNSFNDHSATVFMDELDYHYDYINGNPGDGLYSNKLYHYTEEFTPSVYNDALGYRVCKVYFTAGEPEVTFYVRDDGGNIVSIYGNNRDPEPDPPIVQTELPVYGAGRLGMLIRAFNQQDAWDRDFYELNDHLGNVRAVLLWDGANLDLITHKNYYPFGWTMPGRSLSSKSYSRFGYQGQYAEKGPETGYNQFEARMYASRLGRWLTTDPAGQYWSPYLGMGNSPVNGVDPDGEAWFQSTSFSDTYNWFTGWGAIKAFFSSSWKLTPRNGTTTNFEGAWVETFPDVSIIDDYPDMVHGPNGILVLNPTVYPNSSNGSINQFEPNWFRRQYESEMGDYLLFKMTYGVVDDFYVYGTSLIYGPNGARHLHGSGVIGDELLNSGINTLTNFVPIVSIGKYLKIGRKTLNAGQFNKLFAGQGVNSAKHGGIHIRRFNTNIKQNINFEQQFKWINLTSKYFGSSIGRTD